jgi:alpha-galactosidase
MERQFERTPLLHSIQTVASRRGMSSHHHNPFVILCDRRADEDHGDCVGMMLVYSGDHKTEIEQVRQALENNTLALVKIEELLRHERQG